jgi:hypothetical protein
MEPEEVGVEEAFPDNEGIEPFDWEDYLYESRLEKQQEPKRNRPADAVV